ncbi:MAG: DUF3943 domain-containing protein [Bacteriovoracaceae bacterium]|nr:DUF3943 domain-containing protein [Bacteriovoracaceae bacterium]
MAKTLSLRLSSFITFYILLSFYCATTQGQPTAELLDQMHYPYMPSIDQIRKMDKGWHDTHNVASNPRRVEGRVLTIDTRDHERCTDIKDSIIDNETIVSENSRFELSDLCDAEDPDKPMVSIVVLRPGVNYVDKQDEPTTKIYNDGSVVTPVPSFSNSSGRYASLLKKQKYIATLGVGFIGVLAALPSSVTKWEPDKAKLLSSLPSKWVDNVTSGPVIDEDEWAINWIGHPVSGAAYYLVARHSELDRLESFGYSVLMSTFFWEYGLEAFAEVPSIQDLLLTPTVGSLLGELFYQTEKKILANKGKLLGSTLIGNTVRFIINPAGMILEGMQRFGANTLKNVRTSTNFVYHPLPTYGTGSANGRRGWAGLEFKFEF